MTDRVLGRKKSAFPANTLLPADTTLDFVSGGTNYKILLSDYLAALSVTGSIVQDGDVLATPVLDTQGSVNNIRNLETDSKSGIATSVSAQNGIYLKLDAQVAAGSGVAVLDADNNIRNIKAGPNATVVLSGDDIVVDVTAALIGLSESALVNTVRQYNVQQYLGSGTLVDGAIIAWDLDTDPIAKVTLEDNRTINFSNAKPGATYVLQIIQDGVGNRTVTWDANIEWAGGIAPVLSVAVAADDVVSFIAFDTVTLKGVVSGLDYS